MATAPRTSTASDTAFFIPDGDRFVATPHGQGPWSTHHLHRHPGDEWVCLEAVTAPEPNGIGLSTSRLFDRRGPIGVAVQGLLLARRSLRRVYPFRDFPARLHSGYMLGNATDARPDGRR